MLAELDRTHPTHPGVIATRVAAAASVGDYRTMHEVAGRFVKVRPNDPAPHLALAESYLQNGWHALALRAFREFLARWPADEDAGNAKKTVAIIEKHLPGELESAGLVGEVGFAHACLHEEVLAHLSAGRAADARKAAEQLLTLRPDFAPATNNLTEALVLEGNLAGAVDACRRVLAAKPDNVHARANLVRLLFLSGRHADAATEAVTLKKFTPTRGDERVKVAEALSFLGDDEGVLAALDGLGRNPPPDVAGMAGHLAAVALYRLDRERAAKQRWKDAVKADPGLRDAGENLDDLARPVGERHAAWPFPLSRWLTRDTIDEFGRRLSGRKSEAATTEAVRQFLRDRPDLAALVPVLLDRGDPRAREFAVKLAKIAGTPETLAALRDFALGRRGPDVLRVEAGHAACDAGLIPTGSVRMWAGGEQRDLMLLGFEITGETSGELSERGSELVTRAIGLMRKGKGAEAEPLLREALTTDPDSPSVPNNIAAALRLQRRDAEADEMIREVHRRFPDYLFGIVGVAEQEIKAGRTEAAAELLNRVLTRRQFHTSEFSAVAIAEIELQLARGEVEGALRWLDMLEESVPDDPNLPALRARLLIPKGLWPFGRKKRRPRG